MTELDHLYAAILAHPAEDVPRLMFADELESLATKDSLARARFIRTCVRREREHGPKWFVNGGSEAGWCEKALVRKWSSWLKSPPPLRRTYVYDRLDLSGRPLYKQEEYAASPLNHLLRSQHSIMYYDDSRPSAHGCFYRFRRGFVSQVTCPWHHWRAYGDVIVQHDPVSTVELTSYPRVRVDEWPESLIYLLEGLDRSYDLHEIRERLGLTGEPPRALREGQAVVGACMLRWPTVAEWLVSFDQGHVPA